VKHLMRQTRQLADRVLALVVIAAMGVLVLDVLWGVVSRYALRAQARWTDELATTLLIWISMLGGALVYSERGHLGLDYLVGKLDLVAQRFAELAVHLLVFAFAAGVMVFGGWVMAERTLASGQVLPALGLPKGYTYFAVPVSGIFLCFYALEGVAETLCPTGTNDVQQESASGAA
jgi:TRAP-type C4-dicarboxylate transport system permease small subunit